MCILGSVVDPDSVISASFWRIRIRIYIYSNFFNILSKILKTVATMTLMRKIKQIGSQGSRTLQLFLSFLFALLPT
jgi:hypothetical protein